MQSRTTGIPRGIPEFRGPFYLAPITKTNETSGKKSGLIGLTENVTPMPVSIFDNSIAPEGMFWGSLTPI
jgi:hypothetical protein